MSLESSKNEFEIRLRRVVELITDNKDAYSQKLLDAADCLDDEYRNCFKPAISDLVLNNVILREAFNTSRTREGFVPCDGCPNWFHPDTSDGCTVSDETTQCGRCVSEAAEQAR